ncbi:MAG: hypothetical protein HY904_21030 [Deltaproteobacteria bacterium]|nr:hypothetical protein [Deltaproteobacteria bacterium]
MRALPALVFLAGCAVFSCTTSPPGTEDAGGGGASSSSGGGASLSSSSGGSSGSTNPRRCGADTCLFSEACVSSTDGSVCRAYCLDDGGCAAGTVCRVLGGTDAGVAACIPGGGVGDPCAPEPCLLPLVCAVAEDGGGPSCRQPCGHFAGPDGGINLECAGGYTCFPAVADGGTGACFPQ